MVERRNDATPTNGRSTRGFVPNPPGCVMMFPPPLLEAADKRFAQDGAIDVSQLEALLEGYLSAQLVGVVEQATGTKLH
jgi:hypothetical protein